MKKKYIKPWIRDFNTPTAEGQLETSSGSSTEGGCQAGRAANMCYIGMNATGGPGQCTNGGSAQYDCAAGTGAAGNLCAAGTNATGGGGGWCMNGTSPEN
ncbi:hypothetical protein JW890_00910 [candidate division WOR-3 bacterium]|nr:hypothetical protein [candidate division WOR-3 bacterium]